jgi:hypothetical protein
MAVMPTSRRYVASIKPAYWPALPLYTLGLVNLGLSFMQMSCLCHEGSSLGAAAGLFGLIFVVRLFIARALEETGFNWIPWAAIFGMSYAWALVFDGLWLHR